MVLCIQRPKVINGPIHVLILKLLALQAPIHLSWLFTPHLQKQKEAAIINVTSGLAYFPTAFAPT